MNTETYRSHAQTVSNEKSTASAEIIGDVVGDITTDVVVEIGETLSTTIELLGDRDYFRITLLEGQQVTINIDTASIAASVNFRDAGDNILASDSTILGGNLALDVTAGTS